MTTDSDAEFTALVLRQARFVFQVAYAVLLNAHEAEDAVQETFLKLYRNRGWQQAQNERAFLARTAWRVALDMRPSGPRSRAMIESLDHADAISAAQPGPDQMLLASDQHARIHAALNTLPEELRVPLLLSSFDELNSREIGSVLGIPEGTVRTRLQRARSLLREKLTRLQGHALEVHHG